jgi:hypothetical protein
MSKTTGEVVRGKCGWEAWVIDGKSGARFKIGCWHTKAAATRYLGAALS